MPGEYFNIGGDTVKTIDEMLQFLISKSYVAHKITVETDPERLRPIDADLQIPDTTKFKNATGWSPEYTFEETMSDLLDYWRDQLTRREVLSR
jgi:nucleoside-diphosphate-sugar epimerase